jgi:hypothetical protein
MENNNTTVPGTEKSGTLSAWDMVKRVFELQHHVDNLVNAMIYEAEYMCADDESQATDTLMRMVGEVSVIFTTEPQRLARLFEHTYLKSYRAEIEYFVPLGKWSLGIILDGDPPPDIEELACINCTDCPHPCPTE